MKPPLILNESGKIDRAGDVGFYRSIVEVLAQIEAIDVENQEYHAFDSEGRLLALSVDENDVILIEEAEAEPSHQQMLRKILIEHFGHLGVLEEWCQAASLSELVEKGINEYPHFRKAL